MGQLRYSIIALAGLVSLTTCCFAEDPPATAPAAPTSAPATAPVTAQPEPPAQPATARGVVETVVHGALTVLRNPDLSKADKLTQIRKLADHYTDFETLSRLSMGRYWRDLNETQQKEFAREFEEHVSATHGKVFDEYVDEDVVVLGERQEQRGDYTVQTKIVANHVEAGRRKDVAKVDYRLRQKDNNWKIIDVTVDGVSMASNFRAQFQDIMANGGYDRLIKLLHDKQIKSGK